jgi:DNA replication protein DnaC
MLPRPPPECHAGGSTYGPSFCAGVRASAPPRADFLSLLLSDEVERRDRSSALLQARAAKLDPGLRIDTSTTDTTDERVVVFDRELWNELCLLRFLDDARGALILGPVGVGKTHYVDLCVMPTWLLNPLRVRVIRLARSA